MKLTDSAIRAAKPQEKAYKLADGNGLTLLIYPNGSRHWRYRYSFSGKETMLSLGEYPEITLKQARTIHSEYRALLKRGINPADHRKEERHKARIAAEKSFEAIARAWWEHWKHGKTERCSGGSINRKISVHLSSHCKPLSAGKITFNC